MNLDELLAHLAETPTNPSEFNLLQGQRRLREGLRRLRNNPAEAQRVRDIVQLVEIDEDDYRAGREALERQDFDTAERHLRRVAEHGHDEAAYWLALLLQLRSDQHRLAGRKNEADDLAAEASTWRMHVRTFGVAEALESHSPEPHTDTAATLAQPSQRDVCASTSTRDTAPRRSSRRSAARAASLPSDPFSAVGIELRPYEFVAALTNEHGELLAHRQQSLDDMEVSTVVQAVADTAEELLTDRMGLRFSRDRVALGLQLASPVDTKSGTVHYFSKALPHHPGFKWEDVPLGSRLRQAINLETIVENDANAFAVKEQWFGVGQEAEDFAVMLIREGLGGSLVRDGRLFSGPVEVGHFICSAGGLRESDAGQWGALECSGGTAAILADIGERTRQVIDDVEAAAALAEEDSLENPAVAAFRAAGNATALGISYLVNIAGPSHIVLYGPAVMFDKGRGATSFLEQVKQFRGRVAYKRFRDCELILRPLSRYDGAHGAALMALQRCFAVAPKAKLSEMEPTR